MGSNTLTDRVDGQTIVQDFFNSIHQAMNGDFIGRNTSGVPTSGQSLGTVAIPWGTIRSNAVIINGQTVNTALVTQPQNVINSGKKRSTSNQPAFITPNGAALSFQLLAATTNLVVDINGSSITVNTDITKSSLTAAPSTQNTCLVNESTAADQHDTRLWGETEHTHDYITVDTMGTNISALVGKTAAFMLDNGTTTEYFLALVESTTKLSKIRRGFFYDSSLAPKNRIFFSDNDTITLLQAGYVFITNDATTVDVTYTEPTWSFTSPSSPATGDYWYDMANNTWKRYDGASFQIINRTFIAWIANTTTACVAARCVDFFAKYESDNSVEIELQSTEIARGYSRNASVNVAGVRKYWYDTRPTWNITTDLAGSADMYDATEQASRLYYLYVKDTGDEVISDISPYYRNDLYGAYHPHNPWRCIGIAFNNASSNLTGASGFFNPKSFIRLHTTNGQGSTNTAVFRWTTTQEIVGAHFTYLDNSTDGASFTCNVPGEFHMGSGVQANNGWTLNATGSDLTTDINTLTSASKILALASTGGGMATLTFLGKIGDVFRNQGTAGYGPGSPSRDRLIFGYVNKQGGVA